MMMRQEAVVRPEILSIDDSPVTHATLRAALEPLDCQVFTAFNAKEAFLRLIKDSIPHLIILDLRFPGQKIEGPGIFRILSRHQKWRSIPVLPLTSQFNNVSPNKMTMQFIYAAMNSPASNTCVWKDTGEDMTEVPAPLFVFLLEELQRTKAPIPAKLTMKCEDIRRRLNQSFVDLR